ncbi:MAG: glycosyltransferase [Verrucomicrobia bacterium]|nr:glycosyltransferase [Verrucomicrobiota bacterium]
MPPVSPPPLSVIVACRNPGPRLANALESVWAQRDLAPELVVVDGASTDGTAEWLERQRDRIQVLISAPDDGVYDAMNKGLAAACGEWVLFLGADDELDSDITLAEACVQLRHTSGGVVAGEVAYADGRVYRLAASPHPRARNFVHHQGAFYRRSLFAEHGPFDSSLRVMADYDFNLRLWKNHVHFKASSLRVCRCGTGGLSDRGNWRGYREEIRVRHRHYPAHQCWLWDAISVVRFVRKKLIVSVSPRHG